MTLLLRAPSRRFMRYYSFPQELLSRTLFPERERSREKTREMTVYAWDPRINVRQEDERVTFRIEVEDTRPEDLDVTVSDGVVTITGARHQERKVEREGYDWREIRHSAFSRRLPLGRGANWKKAEASFEDGVLEVSVPVVEEKPKHIEIQ